MTDDRDTAPPTDGELEGLAAFELMIAELGEQDARMNNTERAWAPFSEFWPEEIGR